MKKLQTKNGLTLVELLISLIVAAILMLVVGVLSDLAVASSRQFRIQTETFNEIMHAYKYIQRKVRENSACITPSPGGGWIGERLTCGSEGIGVWNDSGRYQLVYTDDVNGTQRQILFQVPDTSLAISFPSDPLKPNLVIFNIQGEYEISDYRGRIKDIPFELQSAVTSR